MEYGEAASQWPAPAAAAAAAPWVVAARWRAGWRRYQPSSRHRFDGRPFSRALSPSPPPSPCPLPARPTDAARLVSTNRDPSGFYNREPVASTVVPTAGLR